jgi:acyl-CoA reductase-like NAD-dependent aldehyde dehydrogenase
LTQAKQVVRDALDAWNKRLEDERAEAQRKAEDESRRAREKLEQAAAAEQAKAEAKAKELRDKAAAATGAQAAKLAAQAEQAEQRGADKAEALRMEADAAPRSVVVPPPVKPTGVAMVTTYKVEVVDKLALVQWVAANPMFIHLLEPSQTALNAQAVALKDQFAIPGCKLARNQTTRPTGR